MRRVSAGIAAAVLLVLLGALAWRTVTDPDIGFHLGSGRWIVENASVPDTDPFTYTVSDHPYLAYHWGFQVVIHGLVAGLGARGLSLACLLVALATALLIADVVRLRRSSAVAWAVVGLAAILASEFRLSIRPELASFFLGALTLWTLERHRAGGVSPLWLLPLIQLVWVNTHVWPIGWAIMAVYVVDDVARARSLRTPLAGWVALSAVALFVNPYHYRAILHPFWLATLMQGENVFAQHIGEYMSPLTLLPSSRVPFSVGVQMNAYRILLLLGVLALVMHVRKRRWVEAGLLVVLALLSFPALRSIPLYAIFAVPTICVGLDDVRSLIRARVRRAPAVRQILAGVCIAGVVGFALVTTARVVRGPFYAQGRRHEQFGSGFCRPCLRLDAADWLAQEDLTGPGFNDMSLGSTLIWRDPEHKVFVDARLDVMGPDFFERYLRARHPSGWPAALRHYRFEYVALAHKQDQVARLLALELQKDPAWRLVFADGAAVVFVRVAGPNGHLRKAALPASVEGQARQSAFGSVHVDGSRSARLWRWLTSPEPAPGAAYELGGLLVTLGRLAQAEAPLLEAVRTSPGFWEVHNNLGVLYERRQVWPAALFFASNALTLAPDDAGLRSRLESLRARARGGG